MGDSWIRVSHGCAPMTEESSGSMHRSYGSTRMSVLRKSHILALVEALALGGPLEDVGGRLASLEPYHLGLVLEVMCHRLWQRADTRFHSSSTRGIGRSWESVVLIALGPMGATRTGIDSRSVGVPLAVSTDRK